MTYIRTNVDQHGVALAPEFSAMKLRELVALLGNERETSQGKLGGRGWIVRGGLAETGPLVIKHYLRGGLLRHFIRSWYVGEPGGRALREFEMLEHVAALGVRAPRPVAALWAGGFFYRAWLAIAEITGCARLADADGSSVDLRPAFDDLAANISILIQNGILHQDFHPGNVLLDKDMKVHLLDFDKAVFTSHSPRWIRDQYVIRWRRAVIKHQLPDELSEYFCLKLRALPECQEAL